MKIGFFAIGIGNLARPDLLTAAAVNAERLNFATIWAPEHVVFLERFASRYPYARGENLPVRLDTPLLNPLVTLTYAAAHTKKIRLATGVCLVPEYNPLLLAKLSASLDYLSGGRFALGIGVGWLKEEFAAMGIPWERRSARTRDYVGAMRALWNEGTSAFKGEFANFEGALSYPKPARGASLPILVGGQTEAALRRAADYGSGWCGFNLTPEETAKCVKRLKDLLKERGRKADLFEFQVSPIQSSSPDDIKRYRDAGVEELYIAAAFRHPLNTEAEVVT